MEDQIKIYREHKEENEIFNKKYWGGKNLISEEKQKNRDDLVMKDLFNNYNESITRLFRFCKLISELKLGFLNKNEKRIIY